MTLQMSLAGLVYICLANRTELIPSCPRVHYQSKRRCRTQLRLHQLWGGFNIGAITLEVTRIDLVTGLFAIGIGLPRAYTYIRVRLFFIGLVGVMSRIFPDLTFVSCLAIAACLTPIDPVICAAIVGLRSVYAMEHIPKNLRRILAAEAAASDGLAYSFSTFEKGVLIGCLCKFSMRTMAHLSSTQGLLFSRTMRLSHARGFADRECSISWDGHFNVQGRLLRVLNCACFVCIGALLPFPSFNSEAVGITPWRLVLLPVTILFLRRIPPVPEIRS
ncbi:hypothetical protein BDN71DRAFT_1479422 [Pleurotus eryngii]|uniref:Cation/H+ exchanger transmembrane domain-containing protein n=1 Tax=Pleurotus eryngii TaxID=5323 RepID=A0A9P6DEI5_PLEER|nr:hypothetical protein BDN71DRAFT_1479422 [Pleurotus eryngii]